MKKRWIGLLLAVCVLMYFAPAAFAEETHTDPMEIYVSNTSIGNQDGTRDHPYTSLNAAIGTVPENGTATIYIMSDMTMSESTRYWDNKDITITSDNASLPEGKTAFTISRGTSMNAVDAISDPARGGYNGALIEVGNGSDLTLTHIVIDDQGIAAYTSNEDGDPYFNQVDASRGSNPSDMPQPGSTTIDGQEVDNHKIVQDAIIASYDSQSTVTLGEGAILQNYGGMSAVRITGSSKLVMSQGSSITDTSSIVRSKGAGGTGPAGAVWLQNGSFEMKSGATISHLDGRAIYMDLKSTAEIAGTVSYITSNKNMWENEGGTVVYIRDQSEVEFSGRAEECTGGSLFFTNHGTLHLTESSFVGNSSANGIAPNESIPSNLTIEERKEYNHVTIDGEIAGITGYKNPVQFKYGTLIIGPTAKLHDNFVNYGTLYIQRDANVEIHGKIYNNTAKEHGGGLATPGHDSDGTTVITMYDGAEIHDNTAGENGGAVMIKAKTTFIMKGGKIYNNTATASGGGVCVRGESTFILEGGEISGNTTPGLGGGIALENTAKVEIQAGTIRGNKMNSTEENDIAIANVGSGSEDRYLTIASDATVGEESIYFAKYGFTMERPAAGVKIGNADTTCENAVTSNLEGQNLTKVVGSFWYQFDDAIGSLTMTVPSNTYDPTKDLYAAIIETGTDGKPAASAGVSLRTVTLNNGSFTLSLPGNETGYAVVLVQEGAPAGVVSVVPADLTIYMGGNDGYDAVYDEDGNSITQSSSLPYPIFKVTAPDDVDVTQLTFTNGESNNSWTLEKISGELSTTDYYRFVAQTGTEVRVQYSNGSTVVTEDEFDPSKIEELFEEYTISIYGGETSGTQVTATDNNNKTYLVATGTGTLTVRAVADENPTSDVLEEKPDQKLNAGTAVAVKPEGTLYTLNNTGVPLQPNPKPSLLFDDIIEDDNSTARTDTIKEKVDETLGAVKGNTTRYYEVKYLDLVDANDGNAWITSSEGMDIYWAYPDGTSQSTNFKLIHFPGLHRDGSNSGFDLEDIQGVTTEEVAIQKTAEGIYFHVGKGGFSPYALVWEVTVSTPVTPSTPADPEDTGVSDLLDTQNHRQHLAGYPDNTFGPNLNMTRAEVAQMFYNLLLEKDVPITTSFEDVPADAWYAKPVNTLASLGIITGVGNNRFEPDRSITRAEFTALAMKFTVGAQPGENIFSDVKESHWFYDAVVGSIQFGWIEGYEDGTFRPQNPITRAEVTSIVNKMLDRSADQEFITQNAQQLTQFTDVTPNHWGYYHIVEATNSHEYTKTNSEETWSALS